MSTDFEVVCQVVLTSLTEHFQRNPKERLPFLRALDNVVRPKENFPKMSLGELIWSKRTKKGLSQEELASKVGCSQPYVCLLETNRLKSINPDTLKNICDVLEISFGKTPDQYGDY